MRMKTKNLHAISGTEINEGHKKATAGNFLWWSPIRGYSVIHFKFVTKVGLILVPNPFRFCDYNNNTLSWTSHCQMGVSLAPTFQKMDVFARRTGGWQSPTTFPSAGRHGAPCGFSQKLTRGDTSKSRKRRKLVNLR